jgi:EAL domain-containing protein (putative c-di-GMP-specific phosphodiesterase class I)
VGDELLQAVSKIIGNQIRDSDTLARIGGDEFNIILPEVSNSHDASRIARKLISCFKCPVSIRGKDILVSLSIGIAVYPQHGNHCVTWSAMPMSPCTTSRAMANGVFLSTTRRRRVQTRYTRLWENEINKAVAEQQFELLLQPQENARGKLVGVEALIRWRHPKKGLIMPAEFIPYAEETGHIVEIGDWVLRESCRLLIEQLRNAGFDDITMSVNISAVQLEQDDFVSKVRQLFCQYAIPPRRVMLEITENILLRDMDQVTAKLSEITQLGSKIAIDDFGVGYSSLNYLQSLPLHTLKIDRSFIARIRSLQEKNSIVSCVIVMARELGLEVIAEGVETEVQRKFLENAKCACMQGFLLGHPMAVEQLIPRYSSLPPMPTHLEG